jgi:hypothetical protein
MGIEADPLQSREHILLSNILDSSWQQGQDLDLAGFIHAIQSPPMTKIGVFDIESFFPSKDRFALAMKLNNLLAAPGFSVWLEGEPLNIDRLLFTAEGKPRMSIFSIAHLNDAERMFFVSLLLTQLLGWMRTQSGTTSLRSLFYMDEIFGYFPPVANPPSKAPLMTLLKQARAFGLGVVLATQNPVDLDYKGLSNTGTWFIGRLQTDRDKERVLDGLEGASASGGKFDRKRMEQILAGLGKRIFLMNNVNEDAPVIFETRWVMSYLRGPLTRNQIKQLMDPKKAAQPESETQPASVSKSTKHEPAAGRPALPPDIPQFFHPIRKSQPASASLFYEPMLLGIGKVYYSDKKVQINTEKPVSLLSDFAEPPSIINWDEAQSVSLSESDVEQEARDKNARFGEPPNEAAKKQNYLDWSKDFNEWLYRNQSLQLLKSPSLSMVSEPGEAERDFRIRLQMVAREKRDELVEQLRQKYASKIASLEDRIRRAEDVVAREAEQAKQQKLQTAISFGTTLLGAFMGRKAISRSTIGKATTAARGASRAMKEAQDVKRAEENVQEYQQQLSELQDQLANEIEQVKTSIDPMTENLESYELRPKKTDISVSLVALTWVPFWQDDKGGMQPAW